MISAATSPRIIERRQLPSAAARETTIPHALGRTLPTAFTDHDARQSVIHLFTLWVGEADETDNGIIAINLRHEPYSHTTVSKAIKWLIKHKLMMRILDDRGGGRGVASRYLIRWSFTHTTLTERRKAAMFYVNHPKHRNTGNLHPIEEQSKIVASKKTPAGVRSFTQSRAFGWAMAQARATLQAQAKSFSYGPPTGAVAVDLAVDPGGNLAACVDPKQLQRPQPKPRQAETPYLQAFARVVTQAVNRGLVKPGPQLGRFVKRFLEIIDLNWRLEADPHRAYSFVVGLGRDQLAETRMDHRLEREHRERQRQRQEAQEHGVDELLAEQGVQHVSDLIKRIVKEEQ